MKILRTLLLLATCATGLQAAPPTQVANSAREAAREYRGAVVNCDMGWALDYMYPPLRQMLADRYAGRQAASEAEYAHRIMGISDHKETIAEAQARRAANLKALRDYYVRMGKDMVSQGLKVESFTVHAPWAEYVVTPPTTLVRSAKRDREGATAVSHLRSGNERSRLVVLPTTLVVSVPGSHGRARMRLERKDYLLAVRDEVIAPGSSRGTVLNKWYFVGSDTGVTTLRTIFPNLPLNISLPDCGDRPLR